MRPLFRRGTEYPLGCPPGAFADPYVRRAKNSKREEIVPGKCEPPTAPQDCYIIVETRPVAASGFPANAPRSAAPCAAY